MRRLTVLLDPGRLIEAVSPQRTMGFTLRTVIRPVRIRIGKLFRIALDRASKAV
jgi:hypothetical protein